MSSVLQTKNKLSNKSLKETVNKLILKRKINYENESNRNIKLDTYFVHIMNSKILSDKFISSIHFNDKELVNLLSYVNNIYNLPSIMDSWRHFQSENTHQQIIIYNIRKLFVSLMIKMICKQITKIKPQFVSNVIIDNFGNDKLTSDIDVNILLNINLKQLLESNNSLYDEYNQFLINITEIYKECIVQKERLLVPYIKNSKTYEPFTITSNILDVNLYPPGPFLKLHNWETCENLHGIIINNDDIACLVPIIHNDKISDEFIINEVSKSIKNGIILYPESTDISNYYNAYIGSVSRGEDCYIDKRVGVSTCLTSLIRKLNKYDGSIEEARKWNDILCCITGTNKFGNELYFTISSIVFVVFFMQICQKCKDIKLKMDDIVLSTIAVPACIEQLCFYILHDNHPKYLDRAKYAYRYISSRHLDYIKEVCETNAELCKVYKQMLQM